MPMARRDDEPAKITSSERRVRSERPCSPSVQRSASARLLLPLPFGPTTALMPGPNSTTVFSANDLKPTSRKAVRRADAISEPPSVGRRLLERGYRLPRCLGLGLTPAAPCSVAEHLTAYERLDDVVPRVRRPLVTDKPVVRGASRARIRKLLQHALGRLERGERGRLGKFRLGNLEQPAPGAIETELEVDRARDRLEERGQN